jgi:hypothetical protein
MGKYSCNDRVNPALILDAGHSPPIEVAGYVFNAQSVNGEFPKHLLYFLDLESRPRNEDDAIRSDTLQLTIRQDLLWRTVPRDQQTPESVSRNTTLFVPKSCQPLLTAMTLTPNSRLYSPAMTLLSAFSLGTIMNRDASGLAQKFVVRGLIGCLGTSPTCSRHKPRWLCNRYCRQPRPVASHAVHAGS